MMDMMNEYLLHVFFPGMHFYMAWHHYQYIHMQLQLPGDPGEGVPGGPHHVEDGHDE